MAETMDKAIEKLTKESKESLNKVLAVPIAEYLKGRVKESESLAQDICQNHKTLEKCTTYVTGKARKELNGKSGAIAKETVYEWAEDYYRLDDKALEEKKAKEEAERKAKKAEQEKKAQEKKEAEKQKTADKVEVAKTEEATEQPKKREKSTSPAEKKSKNDMEGQLDFFSLMNM